MSITKKSEKYVPSLELRETFKRLRHPMTEEDRQLASAYDRVQQDLKRLWANGQSEVEEWERKQR